MKSAAENIKYKKGTKYTIKPINVEFECFGKDVCTKASEVINKWIDDNIEKIKGDLAPDYMDVYDESLNYVMGIPRDEVI